MRHAMLSKTFQILSPLPKSVRDLLDDERLPELLDGLLEEYGWSSFFRPEIEFLSEQQPVLLSMALDAFLERLWAELESDPNGIPEIFLLAHNAILLKILWLSYVQNSVLFPYENRIHSYQSRISRVRSALYPQECGAIFPECESYVGALPSAPCLPKKRRRLITWKAGLAIISIFFVTFLFPIFSDRESKMTAFPNQTKEIPRDGAKNADDSLWQPVQNIGSLKEELKGIQKEIPRIFADQAKMIAVGAIWAVGIALRKFLEEAISWLAWAIWKGFRYTMGRLLSVLCSVLRTLFIRILEKRDIDGNRSLHPKAIFVLDLFPFLIRRQLCESLENMAKFLQRRLELAKNREEERMEIQKAWHKTRMQIAKEPIS